MRRLGAGGMGAVYEAIQLDLERAVAVKVVTETSIDAKSIGRLRQEAIAAARLDHPNVVAIIDFGTDDEGHPFIVMEQLVGESLRDVIVKERRLPVARAVHIARQMLDALGAVHDAGIVHRDVKPGNVMLLEDDRVKLVDFGIARLSEDERSVRTTTGTLLGTPAYLSPEQLDGRGVDARTDLHAVGLCLFEMLLGARPWRGSVADIAVAVLRTTPPRVDDRRNDVPRALGDVIERALAKDPRARHASAREMNAALVASIPPAAAVPIVTPPPPPKKRSAMVAVSLVSLVALVTVVTLVVFARSRGRAHGAPIAPAPSAVDVDAAIELAANADAATADAATAEAATVEAPAKAKPAAVVAAATAGERVLCADPALRYGHLCAAPHPACSCTRRDEDAYAVPCAVPFVDNQCPSTELTKVPPDSKPDSPCSLNLWVGMGDGGARTWQGTGYVTCSYCNMHEWRNEMRRGVVGAPCSGFNHLGKARAGRYLRY